ncbi:AfsR/SARP family transcriptional regulator [Nonomuraea basaltis]|uniref:AfsR/SARP family transcriptional regulator n=1 Tax=Nonomuraea basaltis TaxID=2495887 RepID=UPI00110C511E|nr:BTAD domain-containing putative transcriptional regulator [Nonomuraea basaltis]TMR99631.1 transcriptional regulator [Nonomuraea basaltis]
MFKLLGRLAVVDDSGRAINVRAARQQAILAVLVLRPGEVVAIDRLISELWQDVPPATAKASLQTYVYRLRRALSPLAVNGVDLATMGNGYILTVPDRAVDIRAFQAAVAEGSDALTEGEAKLAAKLLREALAMWRGPVVPEIDVELVRDERRRLDELHLTARELCVEAELRLGHHNRVIPELERLVEAHPFRESSWAMLLHALAHRGRRAEALAAYRRMRDILNDELGIEPADELRRQHQDILRGNNALIME